jgi:hypothetical protein
MLGVKMTGRAWFICLTLRCNFNPIQGLKFSKASKNNNKPFVLKNNFRKKILS